MGKCRYILALLLTFSLLLSCGSSALGAEEGVGNHTCEVVFADYDGTILSRQSVPAGEAAVAPGNPLRPGYRFMGWDREFSAVAEDMIVTAIYREIPFVTPNRGLEIVGEWVWASTVFSAGADAVVERCARNGITDIYLLTKGTKGTLYYNSTQYPDVVHYENRDILGEMVDAAHAVGIRIHAWIACGQDESYKYAHPEAGLYHYTKGRDNNNIALNHSGYRTYMANIVKEIITKYRVDGIHLDYIRYNVLLNGWGEEDFAALKAMGANVARAKYLLNKTYLQNWIPAGDVVDSNYIFNQYKQGDKNALLMGQYRRNNVVSMATALRDAAKGADSQIVFSAAIMPEGLLNESLADLHYGQNYADTAKIYDYVVPMAYAQEYGYTTDRLTQMIKQCVAKGNKVVLGVQAYDAATTDTMLSGLKVAQGQSASKNVLGVAFFRHGTYSYQKINYSHTHNTATVELFNTYTDQGYKKIDIYPAEGVNIHRIGVGGDFSHCMMVISRSFDYAGIGPASADGEYILPPMGDGTVCVSFSGTPTASDTPLFTVTVYLTDGTVDRAYKIYNDVTENCRWDEGVTTKASTCTEEGQKTFTCSACGKTETEIIPATGHLLAFDKEDAGGSIHCAYCGRSCSGEHDFSRGDCICGAKKVTVDGNILINHTLNLASDIAINYVVKETLLSGYDSFYMECVLPVYEGNTLIATETVILEPELRQGYYYFVLEGLTAVNMKDRIRSLLYGTKDGELYCSEADEYSIAQYGYSQLSRPTVPEALKSLCAELLRYGAKAQMFKGYRTDSLADADMTEADRAYLSHMDDISFGDTDRELEGPDYAPIQWVGKALDLEAKVCLKFIFSMGSYTGKLEDLSLRVTYEDIRGEERTLTLSNGELYHSDLGYYVFTVDTLSAAELRSVVTVQIYAGETPMSHTLEYSADTYGKGKPGALGDLCKALFAYADSAKNFFV